MTLPSDTGVEKAQKIYSSKYRPSVRNQERAQETMATEHKPY